MDLSIDRFPDENWLGALEPYLNGRKRVLMALTTAVPADLLAAWCSKEGLTAIEAIDSSASLARAWADREFDLLIVDTELGTDLAEWIQSQRRETRFRKAAVLAIGPVGDSEARQALAGLENVDYLRTPVDELEFRARVSSVLRMRTFEEFLTDKNRLIDDIVQTRTRALFQSRYEVIQRLAKASEYRDNETGRHVIRVGHYASIMARGLGLPEEQVELLLHTTPMHDIGKIAIRDDILLKPGKLTPAEWDTMKTHTLIGYEMLMETSPSRDQIRSTLSGGDGLVDNHLIRTSAMIALTHHEKWDGTGYPLGLRAREIPLEGRIVAIADVYDALQSERPYKRAFPMETCLKILRDSAGQHLDSEIVRVFFDNLDAIREIQTRFAEPIGEAV